jgi:hypothetical protein
LLIVIIHVFTTFHAGEKPFRPATLSPFFLLPRPPPAALPRPRIDEILYNHVCSGRHSAQVRARVIEFSPDVAFAPRMRARA